MPSSAPRATALLLAALALSAHVGAAARLRQLQGTTPTMTATMTPTASGTPTMTGTMTATSSNTMTATSTQTSSQTSTASRTPSSTMTGTQSATKTPVGTGTPSMMGTQSVTRTPVPTGTMTGTHTGTRTASASGTSSPSGTASPSGTLTVNAPASPSGTPSYITPANASVVVSLIVPLTNATELGIANVGLYLRLALGCPLGLSPNLVFFTAALDGSGASLSAQGLAAANAGFEHCPQDWTTLGQHGRLLQASTGTLVTATIVIVPTVSSGGAVANATAAAVAVQALMTAQGTSATSLWAVPLNAFGAAATPLVGETVAGASGFSLAGVTVVPVTAPVAPGGGSSGSSSNTGAIVGGVIGGIGGAALLAAVAWFVVLPYTAKQKKPVLATSSPTVATPASPALKADTAPASEAPANFVVDNPMARS